MEVFVGSRREEGGVEVNIGTVATHWEGKLLILHDLTVRTGDPLPCFACGKPPVPDGTRICDHSSMEYSEKCGLSVCPDCGLHYRQEHTDEDG